LKDLKDLQYTGAARTLFGVGINKTENEQQLFDSIFQSSKELIDNNLGEKEASSTSIDLNDKTNSGDNFNANRNYNLAQKNIFQFVPTHQMPTVKNVFTSNVSFSTTNDQSSFEQDKKTAANYGVESNVNEESSDVAENLDSKYTTNEDNASFDISVLSESNSQALIFCTFVMPNVPGVIPSAAAELPSPSAKSTRLEYITMQRRV
ncbi:hypothetical protein BB561_006861, partial [Smittium simulii]